MKLNLPNKLTVLRVFMVPFFMVFILYKPFGAIWSNIIAAAFFILTALTDLFDGKIARKRGLITDFGKFLDPLADKIMIIGAFLSFCTALDDKVMAGIMVWATIITVFREFAVTSIRLLASNDSGVVVAANFLGKLKTMVQSITVIVILLEPIVFGENLEIFSKYHLLSYIGIVLSVYLTIHSGWNYIKAYWHLLDPSK